MPGECIRNRTQDGFLQKAVVFHGDQEMMVLPTRFPSGNLRRLGVALLLLAGLPGMAQAGPPVLYTNDFGDILAERFEADTGRNIRVVEMTGGNLLARIAAERNNPRWDVVLLHGTGSLHNLDEEGQLLRDWRPDALDGFTEQGRELVPDNLAWLPAGATASCVIAYRTDRVRNPLGSLDDLTERSLRGRIGQADPAVAAPAYPCVAWLHYSLGIPEARRFYDRLFDNGLRVFPTNVPLGRALAAGDVDVALLSSPMAYTLKNAGEPLAVVWPEEGAPASSRGVAIQARSRYVEDAQVFVEWLLSPATQQFLVDHGGADGYFLSPVDGVRQRPDGPPHDARYLVAPAEWSADNEAAIKTWFSDQAIY